MLCQIPVEAAQLPAQRIGYTAGRAFAPDLAQQVQVSVSQGGKTGIPGPPGRKAPAQAVGPVSYTHLDVYKRQQPHRCSYSGKRASELPQRQPEKNALLPL